MQPLVESVLRGDVRAAARLCRLVDDRAEGYRDALKAIYPRTGKAWVIGVTGNPGAGKSTLTDALVATLRREHPRVGVVAVDPTSPFSGGAILGDRIRMQRHFEDPGVFIRSVATRGALGGLSRSAMDVARVLEAWGATAILVETVGVGQDELDITRSAHTTLVVVAPGLGDDVQANKAGLLECADVFAVNKADRAGADSVVRDLENMLALGALTLVAAPAQGGLGGHGSARLPGVKAGAGEDERWVPPIVKTVSTKSEGIDELAAALRRHREWLLGTSAGRERIAERGRAHLAALLRDTLAEEAARRLGPAIAVMAERVLRSEIDPYSASEELMAAFRAACEPEPR